MRFQRLINSPTLEFYRVNEKDLYDPAFGYLLIYDKREPAELKDFTVFYNSHIEKEIFDKSIKDNHIYAMFFHFTDLELESEIPKFSEVIRFIEDLLLITEASHYVDNYLIDKDLERTGPIQYEKIGQFAKSLVAISKREIAVPFTDRKNYLHLSQ